MAEETLEVSVLWKQGSGDTRLPVATSTLWKDPTYRQKPGLRCGHRALPTSAAGPKSLRLRLPLAKPCSCFSQKILLASVNLLSFGYSMVNHKSSDLNRLLRWEESRNKATQGQAEV